jgi:ribonuclease-3
MLDQLQERLGYTFKNIELLERALIHSSCDIKKEGSIYDNERLEFLGDRVLGLAIADQIFHSHKEDREGMLAKRHTSLVRKEALADMARKWKIEPFILMSDGEEFTGGREKDSILADTSEAILAAIYLDAGFEFTKNYIQKNWQNVEVTTPLKDAKSILQELLQKKKESLPLYELLEMKGHAHNALFVMEVKTVLGSAKGEGSSKQKAELYAAENLLKSLKENV